MREALTPTGAVPPSSCLDRFPGLMTTSHGGEGQGWGIPPLPGAQ